MSTLSFLVLTALLAFAISAARGVMTRRRQVVSAASKQRIRRGRPNFNSWR